MPANATDYCRGSTVRAYFEVTLQRFCCDTGGDSKLQGERTTVRNSMHRAPKNMRMLPEAREALNQSRMLVVCFSLLERYSKGASQSRFAVCRDGW